MDTNSEEKNEESVTQEVKEEISNVEEVPTEVINEVSYRDKVNNMYIEKNGQEAATDVISAEMLQGRDINKIVMIIIGFIVFIFVIYLFLNKTNVINLIGKKEEEQDLKELININETYGVKIEKTFETYTLPEVVEGTCTTAEHEAITWNYCLDNDGNAINVYSLNPLYGDVEIPSELDNHKVISVGMNNSNRQFGLCVANVNCRGIISVTIPDGVLYIARYFLMNGTNIEKVNISNTVKYIGDYAFSNAPNIMSINSDTIGQFIMPENLEYYGTHLFSYNKYVNDFQFPESIDYINSYTFEHCEGFRKLVIPGQYKYVMPGAFADNTKITTLTVEDGVYVLSGFAGNTSLQEVVIADSVKYIYEKTFSMDNAIEKFEYNGRLNYLGLNIFSGTNVDINQFLTLKNIDLVAANEAVFEDNKMKEEEKKAQEETEKAKRQQEQLDKDKQEQEKKKSNNGLCSVTDPNCTYDE